MDIKSLSSILQNSGIVGAGGAGFPTYAKLDQRAEIIILNCAECAPLLQLHKQLLSKHTQKIVEAFHMIGQTVGAKEMIIGIKATYTSTIEALNECIDSYPGVRLGILEEMYPTGDEVVLIYELTKKVIKPGGLPIDSGIVVFNVETVYNTYHAVGDQQGVQHKLVSVVAEVYNPITVRVPIGTSIGKLVEMAGGSKIKDPVYIIGGSLMGFIGSAHLPVTKTTNAVIVLPESHLIVQKKKSKVSIDLKRAAAACCQCTMCTDLCPRNSLGHPVEPHKFMRAATCKDIQQPDIFLNTMFCSACGVCEFYSCMQGLSPRTLMTEYKAGLRANGVKPPEGVRPKPVGEDREYRKVPTDRLIARLDLARYDKEAPLADQVQKVDRVKIMLNQHIGAPAEVVVTKGDHVREGQVIAQPAQGLSVAIHASITGKVMEVTEKYVTVHTYGIHSN